jgi:hypothetical protein
LISWLLCRSRPLSAPWPATILDIARQSEARNPSAGLTGFLVFSDLFYLHFLEGPADAIAAAFKRVSDDPRHEIDWSIGGEAPRRRLPGLAIGYFDSDREQTATSEREFWRDGTGWTPASADKLIDGIVALAREKYPRSLSGADHDD